MLLTADLSRITSLTVPLLPTLFYLAGVTFNPSPSPSGLGAPGSPRSLFSSHSPNPYGALSGGGVNNMRSAGSLQMHSSFTGATSASLAAADAAAAAAAAALNQLPSFYYQAAAAAAGGAGAAAAAANNLSLQAALSQSLMSQHTASLAAVQQQQMQQQILQASLSAAFSQANNPYLQGYPSAVLSSALEPMRSAGGSLSLDGGLQQQASAAAAAAAILQHQQQQHHHAAAQLRRNMSTPAAVAAQLQLSSAAAAASASLGLGHASALSASASGLSPLTAQMGRLHVTHSADLSHLDAAALLGSGSMGQMAAARSQKFKARKNSEPKIGPDGQPRLNARQRRTLRRAKERALKGLLEVSQALLQKAEVQVTVPNISHLTALEELATVEAEKEAAASEKEAAARSNDACLSPDQGDNGSKSGSSSKPAGGQTRSQQLAAAAAAVEESVCEIARAAVAAVSAQAAGKDTSTAAAAAKAAAANAASAAASAGAVLPPNFVMPENEEPNSDELPVCEGMDCLSHSAPTSPFGSAATAGEASSSGRSSSSSSSGGATSSRCSSSSGGAPGSGKPPKAAAPPALVTASSLGSPLVSPSPSPTPAAAKGSMSSQLEGIDIAGLIGQLSLKKDEGMVDDKLIRDLQIIQSLIGALKAPNAAAGLESASSLTSPVGLPTGDVRRSAAGVRGSGVIGGGKGPVGPKRAHSYSPGTSLGLHHSLPH
jgi:hypothetical protein